LQAMISRCTRESGSKEEGIPEPCALSPRCDF
jgi:hypothetical protein